jgi:hypothetical protein
MTQPPKGGPAFANTPDVATRQQPPAAPAQPGNGAVNGTSPASATQTGHTGPVGPSPWSAPTEAPGTTAAYPLNSPRNGSAPAPAAPPAPVPAAPSSSAGFGAPTINNGSVSRTAAAGPHVVLAGPDCNCVTSTRGRCSSSRACCRCSCSSCGC